MAIRHARSDAEIERDVKDILYADLRISSENIEVEVRGGIAHLRGSVPNTVQKALARDLVGRIKGVRRVASELEVIPLEPRSDADITADVATALALDSLVDEDKINVTTSDGVVHLEGTVNSYTERKAAYDDARQVAGVVDVINEILVAPSYARADEEIAREVRHQIEANLRMDTSEVEVEVVHGVAYLKGNVATVEQRWIAGDLARWTPGVIDVVNDLNVVTTQGP